MKAIARGAGATFAFDSVAMRPARPTAFATLVPARLAILSGNPAAVFVALVEFVGPALRAMQGVADPRPPRIRARLRDAVRAKSGRTYLPFVAVRLGDEGFEAELLENQCSALTRTAATAHGLAVVGPEAGDLQQGDLVPVDLYRSPFDSPRIAVEGVPAREPGIHTA
jgi:molybdopterin molybdotransferase